MIGEEDQEKEEGPYGLLCRMLLDFPNALKEREWQP